MEDYIKALKELESTLAKFNSQLDETFDSLKESNKKLKEIINGLSQTTTE